ncbi:NUDIX hydrolase [Actinoalloteichus caeruleus]|uniref:NUDIX hydrolase n=1 Tax=Actinoalloteichus cyanogriseus TaxID=2893586 RepID=UPI0004AA4D00|nr:NUDIX domain-containing protein [Actinoalloteichus caeruleus]
MVIDKVAWLEIVDGAVLCARSRGKELFYLPGGKRDPGETDVQTLVREVDEELGVEVLADSAEHVATVEASADGKAEGVLVRMACYRAEHRGTPEPRAEIEELAWLTSADRERLSEAGRAVFDDLRERGLLN